MKAVRILDAGVYKAGDPPPEGYVQWHEWAATQTKAGLRQTHCGHCSKWHFPQEVKPECGEQLTDGQFTTLVRQMRKLYPEDKGEKEYLKAVAAARRKGLLP